MSKVHHHSPHPQINNSSPPPPPTSTHTPKAEHKPEPIVPNFDDVRAAQASGAGRKPLAIDDKPPTATELAGIHQKLNDPKATRADKIAVLDGARNNAEVKGQVIIEAGANIETGKLIASADEKTASRLVEKYGPSLSPAGQDAMVKGLVQSGKYGALADFISTMQHTQPGRAQELVQEARKDGADYNLLLDAAIAHRDGFATDAITGSYYNDEIKTGKAPLGGKLTDQVEHFKGQAELKKHGVHHPDEDMRHLAATGEMTPELAQFVTIAHGEKDLKLAKEILDVRETALANRFASLHPGRMGAAELNDWKITADQQKAWENDIDKSLGHKPNDAPNALQLATRNFAGGDSNATWEAAAKASPATQNDYAAIMSASTNGAGARYYRNDYDGGPKDQALLGRLQAQDAIRNNPGEVLKNEPAPGAARDAYRQTVSTAAKHNPAVQKELKELAESPRTDADSAKFAREALPKGMYDKQAAKFADEDRKIADAMHETPPNFAVVNKMTSHKMGADETRAIAHSIAAHTPDDLALDKLKPESMRARVAAERAGDKAWNTDTFKDFVPQNMNEADKKAFLDQVTAYSSDDKGFRDAFFQKAAKYAMHHSLEDGVTDLAQAVQKAGYTDELTAAAYSDVTKSVNGKDATGLRSTLEAAEKLLPPGARQDLAQYVATETQHKPIDLSGVPKEMFWRIEGEQIRLTAGEGGKNIDAAIDAYRRLSDLSEAKTYSKEFRAGISKLLDDPDAKKALQARAKDDATAAEMLGHTARPHHPSVREFRKHLNDDAAVKRMLKAAEDDPATLRAYGRELGLRDSSTQYLGPVLEDLSPKARKIVLHAAEEQVQALSA